MIYYQVGYSRILHTEGPQTGISRHLHLQNPGPTTLFGFREKVLFPPPILRHPRLFPRIIENENACLSEKTHFHIEDLTW